MRAWILRKFKIIGLAVYYGIFVGLFLLDNPINLKAAAHDLALLPRRAVTLGTRLVHRRWFGEPARFALIINSDDALRHLRNVKAYTRHLKNVYGVPEENILVLCTISCEKRFAPATKTGFVAALEELRRRARGDDILFVYTTGHGGRNEEESWLELEDDGRLTQDEFAERILTLPVGRVHYYGDQCYSGAFARRIEEGSDRDVLAMSATGPQTSCACQMFTPFYLKAFDADPANVSEWEALTAARRHAALEYDELFDAKDARPSPAEYFNSGPPDWDSTLRMRPPDSI